LAPAQTLMLTPAPARTKNNDSGSCSSLKCKLWPESTPAPWSSLTHIPFVVNRAFNTTLTDTLQHLQQGWVSLFEMTESERNKQIANW